jgi:hypothetical protein
VSTRIFLWEKWEWESLANKFCRFRCVATPGVQRSPQGIRQATSANRPAVFPTFLNTTLTLLILECLLFLDFNFFAPVPRLFARLKSCTAGLPAYSTSRAGSWTFVLQSRDWRPVPLKLEYSLRKSPPSLGFFLPLIILEPSTSCVCWHEPSMLS